ncbi:MAG: hypothetical protein RI900_358 [Actinomycetota bacterium]
MNWANALLSHDDLDLRHLWTLSTPLGIWEHCDHHVPRQEHGYCTDDTARLLVLASRLRDTPGSHTLVDRSLQYLEGASRPDGRFVDRRAVDGQWIEDSSNDDACGRALWGLGVAAATLDDPVERRRARLLFEGASSFRSPFLRSTSFAVLGAAAVLARDPGARTAHELLDDAAESLEPLVDPRRRGPVDVVWPWPEDRLTYANALIPHALLSIAQLTGDHRFTLEGFRLLRWLVATETHDAGHLSPTPSTGWRHGEPRPGWDQQPIEVATLAECAVTAWQMSGETDWLDVLGGCSDWFLGHNDLSAPMVNPDTGGGFDGLTAGGPNRNQGAESTLAALSTLHHARELLTPALL